VARGLHLPKVTSLEVTVAEAIPKAEWSEAEEYGQRFAYWEYLVNSWLVPGPVILKEQAAEPVIGEPRSNLHDYGWLLEPDSLVEQ
jgi:hypothetical protein